MDYKTETLAHWRRIDAMAARRFGEGPLAEEASLAVLDGLREGDWRRLRAFDGRSSFATYLLALTARLLEDFARRRFGRVRPPRWVENLGGLWRQLFEALCLQRLSLAEAVATVGQRQAEAREAEIESAAHELLARIVDCGRHQGLEVPLDEEEAGEGAAAEAPTAGLEARQRRELLAAVSALVLGREEEPAEAAGRRFADLRLALTAEERLLLKLCYQDGLAVAEAGQLLDLNRFQAHGRLRRLLARLRAEFARAGLEQELRLQL